MSAEAERLRRSKRNKFFLDVAALNSSNHERRKSQLVPATSPEPTHVESPGPSVEKESGSPAPIEEENKRSRRPTKNQNFVYADESDDEDDGKNTIGMYGSHRCTKCPSRFETRPGLANHFRLHGADKRKFSCDSCDFSCGSAKAMRNHKRCHSSILFKEDSPSQTHSDTRSDTSESHTPPQLTPVRGVPTAQTPTFGGPPQLAAVSPNTTPSSGEKSSTRKRNRCPECPFAVRNRRRFENHLLSHKRTTGFQCHSCTLTTLSSGFLKRHIVEVHKETSYPWPPKFINEGNGKLAVANDVEPPRPSAEKLEKRRKHRGKLLLRAANRKNDVMKCPVEGCSYECFCQKQMVFHKRRLHSAKAKRPTFRCSACGLRMKTAGALKVHRLIRHPQRKMHPKAKITLFSECIPRFFLKHLLDEVSTKGAPLTINTAMDSAPPTPSTPSPAPILTGSKSAPLLTSLNGGSPTVSSSLLGLDLPDCLKGIDFDKGELEAELQKAAEHEFLCEECPFTTSARAKLDRHVSRHQIKSDLQCPLCSFSCRGDDIIKTHVRLHMAVIHKQRLEAEKFVGDLPSIFAGSSAGASQTVTSSPTTTAQPSPAPSVSGKVPAATPVTSSKTTVQNKGNGRRKAYPNTSFITKGGMRMRRCLECPYITRHSCDLLSHYNMHTTSPQRYKCSQCSYSTKRSVCLKSHYQSHREQNAEKSTKRQMRLRVAGAHIGIRSGCGQFRIYSCSRCPFVSRTLVVLWQHARAHLFRRRAAFKCSACTFFSSNSETMEDHLLLHSECANIERLHITPVAPKRHATEARSQEKPAKLRRMETARASPLPILVKEDPVVEEVAKKEEISLKMDVEESNDAKYESATTSSRSSVVPPLDAPLSIIVQEFMKPEPELLILLRKEHAAEEDGRCPDCPFTDPDELVMRIHRDLHRGPPRPMKCDLCTFSCHTAEALHYHISLHLPALSPNSAAAERRKAAQRRRAQNSELIPHGVPHYACNKCSFRTMTNDSYRDHMLGHAQELQRRLLTTIKRSVQSDDGKANKIIRRTPKKADKFYCCTVCSFRCETNTAFYRHQEQHTMNGLHKCTFCTYSANTLSITQYHEMNHHSDHTLTGLTKAAILAPHAITLPVERTEEKIQKLVDNVYRCVRCPEFVCYEILDLRRHFEALHNETEDDKKAVESLALGMLPMNSIVTLA